MSVDLQTGEIFKGKHLTWKDKPGLELAIAGLALYPTLEQAKAHMRDYGYDCTTPTLETLKRNKAAQIEEARSRLVKRHDQALINQARANALQLAELEGWVTERVRAFIEEHPHIDPTTMLRNLSQAKAQNLEKTLTLEGRPTEHVELQMPQVAKLQEYLEAQGIVQGTALEDADVVEKPAVGLPA